MTAELQRRAMRELYRVQTTAEAEAAWRETSMALASKGGGRPRTMEEAIADLLPRMQASKRLWSAFTVPQNPRHLAMYRFIQEMCWLGTSEEVALTIWLRSPNCKFTEPGESFEWNIGAWHKCWRRYAKPATVSIREAG